MDERGMTTETNVGRLNSGATPFALCENFEDAVVILWIDTALSLFSPVPIYHCGKRSYAPEISEPSW